MWVWGVLALAGGLIASIALHEAGHMIPAKRFGARVTEFMVGFGPRVWSTRKGGTEYGVRLLPLGGYVRILGMMPPGPEGRKSLPMVEHAREQSRLELSGQEERAFWRLSPGRKALVMAGGPLVNLILWLILSVTALCVTGVPGLTTQVKPAACTSGAGDQPTVACSPAAAFGVHEGDSIVAIAGQPVSSWEDIPEAVSRLDVGQDVAITVSRGGQPLTLNLKAGESPRGDGKAWLGVSPVVGLQRMGPSQAAGALSGQLQGAARGIVSLPVGMASLVADTLTGSGRDADSPVGVVGIGRISGEVAGSSEVPWQVRAVQILLLLAGLNLALFLFNMVPLLPLDGGHIAAAGYEAARRKWARWRRRPDPGPVDVARLLPLSYAMAIILMGAAGIILIADVVNPLTLA